MQHNHPLFRDSNNLDEFVSALTRLRRDVTGRLALPQAEACLDDTDDMIMALLEKFTAARDLTNAEIERIMDAEFAT